MYPSASSRGFNTQKPISPAIFNDHRVTSSSPPSPAALSSSPTASTRPTQTVMGIHQSFPITCPSPASEEKRASDKPTSPTPKKPTIRNPLISSASLMLSMITAMNSAARPHWKEPRTASSAIRSWAREPPRHHVRTRKA